MIQYNSNVAWDGPVGSDQILTAFLHSQFREDTSQRPSFDFGFTALRRSELVRLARTSAGRRGPGIRCAGRKWGGRCLARGCGGRG